MSFNNDESFDLRPGMFVTCSGYWDDENKIFNLSDSTQIMKCCLNDCIEPVKYCHKYCEDNHGQGKLFNNPLMLRRCYETCNDQRQICLDTCKLSSEEVGPKNLYNRCAYNHGCRGLKNVIDDDCVHKNRDSIFECCRKRCIPSKNLDCQKHCEFLDTITNDPKKIGIPKVSREMLYTISNSKYKTYPDKTWIYILISLIFCVVFIIFYLI